VAGTLCVLFLLYQLITIASFWYLLYAQRKPIPPAGLAMVLYASHSGSYLTFGKLGIPLRIFLLKELYRVPYPVGTAASAAAAALDILVTAAISLWAARSLLLEQRLQFISLAIVTAGLAVSLTAGLAMRRVKQKERKTGSKKKTLTQFAKDVIRNLSNFSPTALALLLVLFTLRRLIFALAAWTIINAILPAPETAKPVPPPHVASLLQAQALALLIGILSMLPMGLGSRDLSLLMFYRELGIPGGVAEATVIVERLLWTLLPLIIGIICANVLGIKRLMQKDSTRYQDGDRRESQFVEKT